jgi:hypothetical protein
MSQFFSLYEHMLQGDFDAPKADPALNQPLPGHAVRLTKDWFGAKAGQIGIIGGIVGLAPADLQITFNPSAFKRRQRKGREGLPCEVSCSGGPGTISTPASKLTPTGETVWVRFWDWKDLPRADGGEDYFEDVPLWEWDGTSDI